MHSPLSDLWRVIFSHIGIAATALAALVIATVAAYLRQQIRSAIKWALTPITHRLPWNQTNISKGVSLPATIEADLISLSSMVDLFLTSADGNRAKYQKTSSYVVNTDELSTYREGVTSFGSASGFSTARGTVAETTTDHGFYISKIDLGDVLHRGSRFINVYAADLHNSFPNSNEHWTQEIAFPTKHLTLQVHFPQGRGPKRVKCKIIQGTADTQVKTSAKVVELAGEQRILWEIENPRLRGIYKLEWVW
jgi:hypothetical protein